MTAYRKYTQYVKKMVKDRQFLRNTNNQGGKKSFTGALWLLSFESFKYFSFLKTTQNIKTNGGIIPTSQFIHGLFSDTTRENTLMLIICKRGPNHPK